MKSKQTRSISLLAKGSSFHGDIYMDHGMSVFGLIEGSAVSTSGLLHVGVGGLVRGPVQGEHVRIDGAVDGNVYSRATLEINGRVTGDIHYEGTIRLGPNASLDGKIVRLKVTRQIEAVDASAPAGPNVAQPAAELHVLRPRPIDTPAEANEPSPVAHPISAAAPGGAELHVLQPVPARPMTQSGVRADEG